jgi:multiple sugar transport system permease protein
MQAEQAQFAEDGRRDIWRSALVHVALVLGALWTLIPIYWIAMTSIKSMRDISATPPVLFPTDPRLEAWAKVIDRGILLNVRNSVIVATLATILCLLAAVPAAYALTRMRLPRRFTNAAAATLGLVALLPPIASVIPLFFLFTELRLVNTKIALIILYAVLNTSFAVWVLRGVFMDVPRDAEEAALMDGDTRFGAVRRILLPAIFPSLFSVAILLFIFSWNEYLIAIIFSSSKDVMTMPVGVAAQIPAWEMDWGVVTAAGTIAVIPVLIASFTLQRFLVRGLTFGVAK